MPESSTAPILGEAGPHYIRITNGGKIKYWVSFSLSFFEANDNRPIVFHTLPAKPKSESLLHVPSVENGGVKRQASTDPSRAKSRPTTSAPRLVSIVEIIKREFIKSLAAKRSDRMEGLHQYNEICLINDLDSSSDVPREEDRRAEITHALSGKNYVKQVQTPYIKITLSLKPLPELVERGATYQPPAVRKLSKSIKSRLKKRERAAKQLADQGVDGTIAN